MADLPSLQVFLKVLPAAPMMVAGVQVPILASGGAMRRVTRGVVAAFASLLTLAAWGPDTKAEERPSAEEVKREVREAVDAIRSYSADLRDEAMMRARSAIERLDRHIERLEERADAQWDRMDRAARERARATLKALRRQRNELAEWSGRLRESSVTAWDRIKEGFVESYRTLADTFTRADEEVK